MTIDNLEPRLRKVVERYDKALPTHEEDAKIVNPMFSPNVLGGKSEYTSREVAKEIEKLESPDLK